MWICKDCNTEFSTPDSAANIFDEINDICPRCGSREIKEVSRCCICGQATDKLTDDYCKEHMSMGYQTIGLLAQMDDMGVEIAKDILQACMEG